MLSDITIVEQSMWQYPFGLFGVCPPPAANYFGYHLDVLNQRKINKVVSKGRGLVESVRSTEVIGCHMPGTLDYGFSQPWVPADTNTDLRKPVSDPRSAGMHQAHFLLPFLENAS